MKPRRILDCVVTQDGRELVLYAWGDTFLIQVDTEDLMWSRAHGSEEAMALLALRALGPRPQPRILVGGLGMGFTLRACLDLLGSDAASVVVAEMFPAVVEWNRGPLAGLAGRPLEDPRVEVQVGDIADLLQLPDLAFDIILLDVDNGPEAFTLDSNRHLYRPAGLQRLREALAPGGVLAIWSAGNDVAFAHQLRRGGFEVMSHRVAARRSQQGGASSKDRARGEHHVIFLGKREG